MHAISLLLLAASAQGLTLARHRGNAKNASNVTDITVAPDRHYEGFQDEWHKEWRRGDFPSWKETQTTAWMDNSYNRYQPKDYVDSQSDGKPSPALVQAAACATQDLKRRVQLQNKVASVCEDMCKEVSAYPKCSQCPAFVTPDATPGVMTWEELLTHMDNLSSWGHSELKAWTKTASSIQLGNVMGNATGNSSDLTVASDRHYEGFKDEWHKEWRRGDFPSWKETQTTAWMDNSYNRYQPNDYVDSQSDGKPSPALVQDAACATQDLKRRAQLQNKLASVCEDMCKEVSAYPKCSQCPAFVPPDATRGVMTWEELLTHMDNLLSWGHSELKAWTTTASSIQLGNVMGNATGNSTDLTVASDRHYEDFKDEWHKEWRRGDFPSWKETQTTAWMDNSYNRYQPKDYVDSQSDGQPSPAR